ncbi:glycoside hydrolase [Candidatus Saccharibacteria bacterium]|nr:glycoside hydrolase [Candidatus Saccharibacteria bacterium]
MNQTTDLLAAAKKVLKDNDQGSFTIPAAGLYPHQWLWDSCFIAIGLRHTDLDRAKTEILSLLRGQWANGMLPNMILGDNNFLNRRSPEYRIWKSWQNPNSPAKLITSGITQPPLIAEAVIKIGAGMNTTERRNWYQAVFPALLAYHEWLYRERDPRNEGLVLQIHPWETGLDNTPPSINEIRKHSLPLWISLLKKAHVSPIINLFRRDTHRIPSSERLDASDALVFYSIQRRLRKKNYDIDKILAHSLFAVEDLTFNAIFISANQHLVEIADFINIKLSDDLLNKIKKSKSALEELWDPHTSQYYSRDFVTRKLLKESSIATLLPLYAGTISKERAKQLVKMLENNHLFGPSYPVPSVPVSSAWFKPILYWQGPTWVNTNWLIIDGLERNGFHDHANALTESTIEMVKNSGFSEYFNPLTGEAAGAQNFSWTAALIVDLLKS